MAVGQTNPRDPRLRNTLGPDQLTEARAVAWELVERPEGMERLVSLTLEWVLRNPVTVCR